MGMNRVLVLSPYRGRTDDEVQANLKYLQLCLRDCAINHGEAPYASHQMMTSCLNDGSREERELGFECEEAWLEACHRVVVYLDRGVSRGMHATIRKAQTLGTPLFFRYLNPE